MGTTLSKDELMVALYGVWHIWKERCRRTFQQVTTTESQLLDFIRDDIFLIGAYHAGRAVWHQAEPVDENLQGE